MVHPEKPSQKTKFSFEISLFKTIFIVFLSLLLAGSSANATSVDDVMNAMFPTTSSTEDCSSTTTVDDILWWIPVTTNDCPSDSGTTTSSNSPPTIYVFSANPLSGTEPFTTTFTVRTRDANSDVVNCWIDFGDGTKADVPSCQTTKTVTHTYTKEGIYTATLTAKDVLGAYATTPETRTIVVNPANSAPVVTYFLATPDKGTAPLTTTFTARASDANSDAINCWLDFGDGFKTNLIDCQTTKTITHTYTTTGTYTATLTPQDSKGVSGKPNFMVIFVNQAANSAPTVTTFTANPTTGTAPLTTTFTVKMNDADADTVNCWIDFGDGTKVDIPNCQTTKTTTHTYTNTGTYTAKLTAKDSNANSATAKTITIVVNKANSAPTVSTFTANPTTGTAPLTTTFTVKMNDVDADTVNCWIDFGDGTKVDIPNCQITKTTTHTYTSTGTYTAKLTAKDSNANSATAKTITIVVNKANSAPTVSTFTANPTTGTAPLTTIFTVKMNDADGDTVNCWIDFGDGTKVDIPNCQTTKTTTHTYTNTGTYTAKLTAKDSNGNSATAKTITIVVNKANSAPTVSTFTANPTTGTAPLTTIFTVKMNDADADTVNCWIDFGDGTKVDIPNCQTTKTTTHTYTQKGLYKAKLIAKDSNGNYAEPEENASTALLFTKSILITVNANSAPEVSVFTANPEKGKAPLEVTFTSKVEDKEKDNLTCVLKFGDGNEEKLSSCNEETQTKHTYTQKGLYTATLTAKDSRGAITTKSTTIYVTKNIAPELLSFEATPLSGLAPLNVNFTAKVQDEDSDELTCTLDFGDGDKIKETNCAVTYYTAHTYKQNGIYTATLTVTDELGAEKSKSLEIVVGEVSPIIEEFTLESSNGDFVPSNLTLNWEVTHSHDLEFKCSLTINGVSKGVNSKGSEVLENYNVSGLGVFLLSCTDTRNNEVTKLIEKNFYSEEVKLSDINSELIVPKVVEIGQDFSFQLKINETLANRLVNVKPIIVCEGIENTLKTGSGKLYATAHSKADGITNTFTFTTNTRDFNLRVPEDTCTFKVELYDSIGSFLTLSDEVLFTYKSSSEDGNSSNSDSEKVDYASIRGKGFDIVDYMTNNNDKVYKQGYNSLEFSIINNENSKKEVEVSVMSRELGLVFSENLNLAGNADKEIQIPMYIKSGVKKGTYTVRISASDGENHQTRYMYIKVE
ncbi:MAG: PKD domain-containing protein [Candidatus Woesearchaeota archaeon]|nr:MAG: PKD domain-containing protein [Candidatus Woesearchaeota archaeon]